LILIFTKVIFSVCVAYFLVDLAGLVDNDPWKSAIQSIAEGKAGLNWGVCFLRGIGCNILVCLAV
jgi:formate transporter